MGFETQDSEVDQDSDGHVLPPGFEDLLEFVPEWIGASAQARWDIRASKNMDQIRYFYDRLLSRSEAILDHLAAYPLSELPGPQLRLLQLQLALAQASMSVELHGQPRVINSPYPHQVRIVRGAQPVD